MITSVLVANRGEIARRVFRTCRDLGIATVAVYSDADAASPHVAEADAGVHLPGNSPADTYLRADLLVDAARRAGADAVHPGYGFLAESAAFARAVTDAGLVWIGPSPEAIDSMGSKIEAKKLMASAGVPVLDELDPETLTADDLPVLVKASAGGGGRGMRVVRALDDLAAQVAAAQSEAASAFGDPTVFCERYVEAGHHVEVQVMADQYGTVWTLGERECSIQRRHQKVVEEAPSPLVERVPGMRAALFEAARAAASTIDYVGAGTVEFLADESGRFYFLEMNTRLQVEHPVTEGITSVDLVRLQLEIAGGAALPERPPAAAGHAVEARLYAEDPAADWQPQTGTLHRLSVPGVLAEFTPAPYAGVRIDSSGAGEVTPFYDAMLAKVIASASTRADAARRLATALAQAEIHGLCTNRDLLVRVLRHPAFLAGDTDTGFLDRYALTDPLADPQAQAVSALAAALADAAANRAGARVLAEVPSGWRNVASAPQRKKYDGRVVEYRLTRDGLRADQYPDVRLITATPTQVDLDVAGVRRRFAIAAYPGLVSVDSPLGPVALAPMERFPDATAHVAAGSLLAPTPGSVARVAVAVGDHVERGQPLLWLEAMKMEHAVNAPSAGIVAELPVAAGQQVDVGSVLAVVERSRP
ncbi:MAG TPA: biotin carboxylase N-terminal domain-containing protein [Jatrophihabitantaceae bacterium]